MVEAKPATKRIKKQIKSLKKGMEKDLKRTKAVEKKTDKVAIQAKSSILKLTS